MRSKAISLTSLVVAALTFSGPGPVAADTPGLSEILARKPALRAFSPQQPKRIELSNGMLILLQEDRELPLVKGYAQIRGGSRDEPASKAGLVQLFGQAWRTGGTKTRTGDALDLFLEARAARVETSGGLTGTGISFDCLTERFEDAFGVVVELLLEEPAFPQDKIDLARMQASTGIARRNDSPDGVASREARRLGYGKDSPYARIPEYATVRAITRDDLVGWHETYVVPNNVVMAVWGDFDAAKMEKRLRNAFGAWKKGASPARAEEAFAGPKPGVYLVERDDATQSKIQLVHRGVRRDTPDYYALEVMNEVFGGGFSARLFTNVRSKKGLAYNVWGRVGMQYDHPGLFTVGLATKSESTVAGIEALLVEVDALQEAPPSVEELQKAKDGILNSFVFRLDSKEKVVREKVTDAFFGYPADLLERYQAGIAKVTAADVHRVAKQYVHADELAILVVGKSSAFDRPLSTLGPVTPVDITIPSAAK